MGLNKQVIILIGLKGCGKTHIGSLLQENLGILFLRVEEVWLSLKSVRLSEEYIREGFDRVAEKIDQVLSEVDQVIIESTGTTGRFANFIDVLKRKYDVKLVKVKASTETCSKRIKARDSSRQVPLSDTDIDRINREALMVNCAYDLILDNETSSDDEILETIRNILSYPYTYTAKRFIDRNRKDLS